MNNEVLKTILFKKEITIKDRILFKTIFEVLSTLFTNEDGVSILKIGYKINDYQQVWFLTISPNSEKEEVIKTGYANFLSEDWNVIYQFNSTSTSEKRKQLGEKYIKDKVEFVTFVKIKEKSKGIGYHFIGIFVFDDYRNKDYKTMVFKKIKERLFAIITGLKLLLRSRGTSISILPCWVINFFELIPLRALSLLLCWFLSYPK